MRPLPILAFLVYAIRKGYLRTKRIAEVSTFGDGATLDVPGTPRVIHVPGHTAGECRAPRPVARRDPRRRRVRDAQRDERLDRPAALPELQRRQPPGAGIAGDASMAWRRTSSFPGTASRGPAAWPKPSASSGPRVRSADPMIPRRVRWLAVVLPAVVVGIIELLSDTVLDPYLPFPWDTLLVMLVVALLAAGFARWTFGRMDRLTTSLEARNDEVETRAASANALHAVSQAIASLADLEEILEATVSSARTLLGADLGLLVLIGPDGEPVLRSTSGPDDAFDPSGSGGGDEASRFLRTPLPPTMLAAPLRRGGTTIGTLAVAGRSMPSHQVGDVETLSSLANHAAIAIENHRLEAELRRARRPARARADRARDPRRARPAARLRQHQVAGRRGPPRGRPARRGHGPDGGAERRRPVELRRRPRGDPGPVRAGRRRGRPRRGGPPLRRPIRRGVEAGGLGPSRTRARDGRGHARRPGRGLRDRSARP